MRVVESQDVYPFMLLTNGSCEALDAAVPQVAAAGLPVGTWNGAPSPLTDRELAFIAESGRTTPAGGVLLMGYSALWHGQKCAAPCIEYDWDDEAGDAEEARARAGLALVGEAGRLRGPVAALGGALVTILDEAPDRHSLYVLVPFTALTAFGSYSGWIDALTGWLAG